MKILYRNNHIEISAIKGLVFGMGYHDQTIIILIGCFGFEVKLWMFKSIPKPSK